MNQAQGLSEWLALLPFGQAALFAILVIILKVLLQSRDQLKSVMRAQQVMQEELDKHQVRDDDSFKVVTTSVGQVQDQLESLDTGSSVTR